MDHGVSLCFHARALNSLSLQVQQHRQTGKCGNFPTDDEQLTVTVLQQIPSRPQAREKEKEKKKPLRNSSDSSMQWVGMYSIPPLHRKICTFLRAEKNPSTSETHLQTSTPCKISHPTFFSISTLLLLFLLANTSTREHESILTYKLYVVGHPSLQLAMEFIVRCS